MREPVSEAPFDNMVIGSALYEGSFACRVLTIRPWLPAVHQQTVAVEEFGTVDAAENYASF